MDFHLSWFRQRLAKLFGIPDGLECEHVDVLINDNYERLKRFFDEDFSGHTGAAQQLEERILFVYRTFYDRLVEKEITVLEEVPHVATPEPEPTKEKRKRGRGGAANATVGAGGGAKEKRTKGDLKDEDAEVKLDRDFLLDGNTNGNAPAGSEDDEGKRRRPKRGAKKSKELDPDVIIETQDFDYIEVKRIVQNYVKTPILHLFFGKVPAEQWNKSVNYFYFVRRYTTPIEQGTLEECIAEISHQFLLGSMRGSYVRGVHALVANIYEDAAKLQFREPTALRETGHLETRPRDNVLEDSQKGGGGGLGDPLGSPVERKQLQVKSNIVVDFTRPSDFRERAVSAKRAGFCATGDDSHLNSTRKLSLTLPMIHGLSFDDLARGSSCSLHSRGSRNHCKTSSTLLTSRVNNDLWDNLSINNQEFVERQKQLVMEKNRQNPIYSRFNRSVANLMGSLDWTVDHIELPFTWPTMYNQEGQEHIVFEEDKVKVNIHVHTCTPDVLGVAQLEDIVKGWIRHVKTTVKELQERQPHDFTPMAEYELWRIRETEYNIFQEQLKHPFVRDTIGKLRGPCESGNMGVLVEWQPCVDELKEEYKLANENYKYLGTLLQEFLMNIRQQTDFEIILTILPNLMVGLRHIWTMSNYFSVDGNMLLLLRKISFVFTSKIKDIMALNKLFSHPDNPDTQTVYTMATKCAGLLHAWKRSYVETRAHIEELGVTSRWEFDRTVLFEDVDHIARICQDIMQVSEIIIQFENMFSSHLKSIITDPEEVDNIMKRVYSLVQLITCIDYDLFRSGNLENWMATIDLFKRKIDLAEKHGLIVLDHCIDALRSAEQGLELINDMVNMDTRPSFRDHVKKKHESVIKKFLTEISFVEHIFVRQKAKLTLQRYEPLQAGSIYWERLLFHHLKKSVLAFRKVEADPCFQNSYLKEAAFTQYFKLVDEMQVFEREKFDSFEMEAIYQINSVIKGYVLKLSFTNDNQYPEQTLAKTIMKRKAPATAKKQPKLGANTNDGKKSFAKVVTNLKWLLNRQMPYNSNLARAKIYLGRSTKVHLPNCLDSAKTVQAKFMLQASHQQRIPTWAEIIGDQVLSEFHLRFEVNFPEEIFSTVSEAQQFERLGFRISPALRMSILRKELLFEDAMTVSEMINSYNATVEELSLAKIHFLRELLNEVETVIQSGLGRLTWQTFNIKLYCQKCQTLLKKLSASVHQIEYFDKIILEIIAGMEGVLLIVLPKTDMNSTKLISDKTLAALDNEGGGQRKSSLRKRPSETALHSPQDRPSRTTSKRASRAVVIVDPDVIVSCDEYFSMLDDARNSTVTELRGRFDSIGPLLIKLESLVFGGTSTGESFKMSLYYQHWEMATFGGLVRLVKRNLKEFIRVLGDEPLFQVDALLMLPEIILRPSPNEIYDIIFASVVDFLERIKALKRWQPGSCIQFDETKERSSDDLPNFIDDIINDESVAKLITTIQEKTKNLVIEANQYLSRWNKYRSLWTFDKVAICERFVNKGLPLIRLDEKFLFYMQVISNLEKHKSYYDVRAIRINLRPLIQNVIDHAMEWKNTLGNILAEKTKTNLLDLQMELKELRLNLDRNIRGLIDFKVVLQTITNIQSMTITVEIKIKEIQETYNVLEEHQLKFPFADLLLAFDLEKRWQKLYKSALHRNRSLQIVKSKFAEMTSKEVAAFNAKLNDFMTTFRATGPGASEMDHGLTLIESYAEKLDYFESQRLDLIKAEQLFDMELTDYTEFNTVKLDFDYLKMLSWANCHLPSHTNQIYKLYRQQQNARRNWSKTLWCNLNANTLTEGIDNYLSEFYKFAQPIQDMPAGRILKRITEDFRESVPIMVQLKNEALRARHWQYLMNCTGTQFDFRTDGHFTLTNIFEMNLHRYKDEVEGIIYKAIRERTIEETVTDIKSTWDSMSFVVHKYFNDHRQAEATNEEFGPNNKANNRDANITVDSGGVGVPVDDDKAGGLEVVNVDEDADCQRGCSDSQSDRFFILGSTEGIVQTLESHCIVLQSMAQSEHVGPFLETVQSWERNLSLVSEIIEEWVITQQKFLYLDGIFSEDEIRAQLYAEIHQFSSIDIEYRQLMAHCVEVANVYRVCMTENRQYELQQLNRRLDDLQKLLKNFLFSKRQKFPRLFFISDDDLLEVLGTGTNPNAIQSHLPKMFDRVSGIVLNDDDDQQVIGLETADGEPLSFRNGVAVSGHRPLEVWMYEMVQEMKGAMRHSIKRAVLEFANVTNGQLGRTEWVDNFPTTVILAASSIWWTLEIEEVFLRMRSGSARAMKELLAALNHELEDALKRVRMEVAMSKFSRLKLRVITIADIQRRATTEDFVANGVCSATDFDWDRQLRFYWMKEFDNVVVVQCSSRFMYDYEFIGLPGRLIVTKLTERIWLTITQALAMNLNCYLFGPAAVGKTETIKELARTLATFFVVANCHEQTDYACLAAVLAGAVQSGTWCCFDDFQKVSQPIMSTMSTSFQQIKRALVMKQSHVLIDGLNLELNRKCGIFVTMGSDRPFLSNSASQPKLIESFTLLFRPVSCPEPDVEHIALVSLIASGFVHARPLARKVSALYKIAKEQLSAQTHYHFGLGSIVKVLRVAGEMRLDSAHRTLTEYSIVVRVLSMINLPVLHPADSQLFKSLIKDLFPGVDCPTPTHAALRQAIAQMTSGQSMEYMAIAAQEAKVIELQEVMAVSQATIVLGATGSGKSTITEILMKAGHMIKFEGSPVCRRITLNPKECDLNQLLGYYESETRMWHDGLFSSIFREVNNMARLAEEQARGRPPVEKTVICFDGDMDSGWVETLNNVLDCNRMLILGNGERIYLQDHCSLMFEVSNLNHVSPAILARCALVYCESTTVGYIPYWTCWLRRNFGTAPGKRKKLQKLFHSLFVACLEFIMEGGILNFQRIQIRSVITQNELGYVRQFCEIFALLLDPQYSLTRAQSYLHQQTPSQLADIDEGLRLAETGPTLSTEINNNGGEPAAKTPKETAGATRLSQQPLLDEGSSEDSVDEPLLECLFIQALYASCGALIGSPADRCYFDEFIKGRLEDRLIVEDNEESPATATEIPTAFPTFYDYFFDQRTKTWVAWRWLVSRFIAAEQQTNGLGGVTLGPAVPEKDNGCHKLAVYDIHVPTPDTMRMDFYLSLCNRSNKMWPVLLLGDFATGKTSFVKHYLQQLEPAKSVLVQMNFSRRTSASYVRNCIENVLVKRTKASYGPPVGKRITVFVDDLHMPKCDRYGSQQPIAFLKALIDSKGYFDLDKHFKWKHLEDLNFIAAMGVPLGGRYAIDERFTSRFFMFNVLVPDDESLCDIYTTDLSHHLSSFAEKVRICARPIVEIMLTIFRKVQRELISAPAKFHYQFNMKDLSRVCAGLKQASQDYCKLPRHLFRLWRNEFTRVMADRLTCNQDVSHFDSIVKCELSETFCAPFNCESEPMSPEADMSIHFFQPDAKEISFREYVLRDPLLYGDYRNAIGNAREPRVYEDLLDYEAIYFLFQEILDEHNGGNQSSNLCLVLFEYCLEHLTRIHRVLRMYRGNVMLVGPSGVGKKSLCQLATFAASRELFEINLIASNYNLYAFEQDLKTVLIKTGLCGEKLALLLNLDQIVDEDFIELINDLLCFGTLADLFTTQETDHILKAVEDMECSSRHPEMVQTRAAKWNYFERTCMENLNVILTMSSQTTAHGNRKLRGYCRDFAGLVGYTTINWMTAWPEEALYCIAKAFLGEHPKIPELYRDEIIAHTVFVHETVQRYSEELRRKYRQVNYVTPKHFLGFIMTFLGLIVRQETQLGVKQSRLSEGINKLDAAVHQIGQLSIMVEEHRKNVSSAAVKYDEILHRISDLERERKVKDEQRYEKSVEVDQKTKQIGMERNAVEQILIGTLPATEEAITALAAITLTDCETEIINNTSVPVPEAIQVILECILVLRGDTETIASVPGSGTPYSSSWEYGWSRMATSLDFFAELQRINLDAITSKQLSTIRVALKKCGPGIEELLLPDTHNRVARALFLFLRAALSHGEAMRDVRPKRERIAYLGQELESQIKVLAKINEDIILLNTKLTRFHSEHTDAIAEKQILDEMLEAAEIRVETSERLMKRFTERGIWAEQLVALQERTGLIPGDCMLGAAFLSYCGSFPHSMRRELMDCEWLGDINRKGIPHSCPFVVETLLGDEKQINWWLLNGLPQGDGFFVENAILTDSVVHFPLLIDPQDIAVTWLRALKEKELIETDFSVSDFRDKLEMAIVTGKWIMFNDVHELMDPLVVSLFKDLECDKSKVSLSGKVLNVHPEFRLYMRTGLSHPQLNPLVFGFAAVINFTVTEALLTDMFHGIIFAELEASGDVDDDDDVGTGKDEHATECHYQMARRRVLERQNERTRNREILMDILFGTRGNLLDQAEVVLQLETVKEEIRTLDNDLLECEAVHSQVAHERREKTDPLAKTATCLFFVLFNFKSIHPVYEFSLDSFANVIRRVMRTIGRGREHRAVEMELVWQVFRLGSLAILDQHFIAFVLQLTIRMQLLRGALSLAQVDFLISGAKSSETASGDGDVVSEAEVLPDQVERIFPSIKAWKELQQLAQLFPKKFQKLPSHIKKNALTWLKWSTSEKLLQVPYGNDDDDDNSLNDFEQLMVLRSFKSDFLCQGVVNYIRVVFGERFLTRPILDMDSVVKQYTDSQTPLLFLVCRQGCDALALLRAVKDSYAAREEHQACSIVEVAVGCSSDRTLENTFQLAQTTGSWLIIANCHLSYAALKRVEMWLGRQRDVHPKFRLFMTASITGASGKYGSAGGDTMLLPVNLLSRSIKVNTEQPTHLKSNLLSVFHNQLGDDMLEYANTVGTALPAGGPQKSGVSTTSLTTATANSVGRRFRSIVYAMTFFHVVALERRKYGKIGWNLEYDFNESELVMCIQMLSTVLSKCANQHQLNRQANLPWPTIRHMLSEIIYSQIADRFDQRLLAAYTEEYFNDFLFDKKGFTFYSGPSFDYRVLDCSSTNEFVGEIERMPSINPPDVTGLHSIVSIQYCEKEMRNTWQCLSKLQIKREGNCLTVVPSNGEVVGLTTDTDTGGGVEFALQVEDDKATIEKVEQLIKILPKSYDIEKVRKTFQINITPSGVVLMQELERFNKLVLTVELDLIDLRNTVALGKQLTLVLELVRLQLLRNEIPVRWRKFTPETTKTLARWMEQLQDRDEQYKFWSLSGEPLIMRLAHLHSPKCYITSLVLMGCRENNWTLESAAFYTEVTEFHNPDEIEERPKSGCYACDIFIEGAAEWSTVAEGTNDSSSSLGNGNLVRAKLRNSINRLPIIRIIPTEMHKLKLQNTVRIPVYYTPQRGSSPDGTGFVFEADLKTKIHPNHWILQGVCLLLNID